MQTFPGYTTPAHYSHAYAYAHVPSGPSRLNNAQPYYPQGPAQYSPNPSPLNSPLESLDNARALLAQRLQSEQLPTSAPSGFPFLRVHNAGQLVLDQAYDFYEPLYADAYGYDASARISFRPLSSARDRYYSWKVYLPEQEQSQHFSAYGQKRSSSQVALAHVRLDSSVLSRHPHILHQTKSSRVVLRALAASLSIGQMVTITLDEYGHQTGMPGSIVLVGTSNDGAIRVIHQVGR